MSSRKTKEFGSTGSRGVDEFGGPTRAHAGRRRPVTGAVIERAAARDDAAHTVMMEAVARPGRDAPRTAASEPTEINVTEHKLPGDGPPDRRLILIGAADGPQAASFRIMRHHLLEQGQPQVVVVSSALPGEGKTTCAINLALALAECGRARVLLVEANVRRPQIASIFRFVPPWCFAEQLAAHRNQPLLPWGVVNVGAMHLHIAAINPRIEQDQLLDAPAFAIAVERLRIAGYDHVVIDCPAVLGSAEVNLIQDAADGVLLTARARTSTARELRRAIEQLSPTKILGTVLIE